MGKLVGSDETWIFRQGGERKFITCNSFLELFSEKVRCQNIFESKDAEFVANGKGTIVHAPNLLLPFQVNLCNLLQIVPCPEDLPYIDYIRTSGLWALTVLNRHAVLWKIVKNGRRVSLECFLPGWLQIATSPRIGPQVLLRCSLSFLWVQKAIFLMSPSA